MEFLGEIQGKRIHDPYYINNRMMTKNSSNKIIHVPGPIIIGAGPSGLAAAACLKSKGVASLVLERSNCIASLWQLKTYDRLRLHLPKQFCELPLLPFPDSFPTYPDKRQFIEYLEDYTEKFDIRPVFNRMVVSAEYDQVERLWRVKTSGALKGGEVEREYECPWLIVATGENAEAVVPDIEGVEEFGGNIMHTSVYKSGDLFEGKRVLVVGCGNSGMEVCLDLCNHNVRPSLVVRDSVHVLPREMLGRSTFGLSMLLLKWFPLRLVDHFLLIVSWLLLGDTAELGLDRPKMGPLELKNVSGKTPVLDVGTLAKIRKGDIKEMVVAKIEPTVVTFNAIINTCARNKLGTAAYEWFQKMLSKNISPNEISYDMLIEALSNDGKPLLAYDLYLQSQKDGLNLSSKAYDAVVESSQVTPAIRRLSRHTVEFVNGRKENFDAIILATGYKSNVPSWLKEKEMFSEKDGLPKKAFPNGWKGEYGLYAVGFTKRGLLGASIDAKRIAEDIQLAMSLRYQPKNKIQ